MALIQDREARKQQEKRLREYVEAKKPLYSALLGAERVGMVKLQAKEEAESAPAEDLKGSRPKAEGAAPAASARRLGLAATIATSPGGLLADTGSTRQRRSLMGGGLIR